MNRRIALKNIGLSLGYVVATPTLIGIMQSCKNTTNVAWTPQFFTKEEGSSILHLVDIILPKTDIPSASEVNAHVFIDKFTSEILEKEKQDFIKMTLKLFLEKSLEKSGKEKIKSLNPEDLEWTLASALKISKEQREKNEEAIKAYTESVTNGETATLNSEVACYAFANNLRGMTIWAYKTSEYIAEKVMAYLPVPGEYIGCESVEKLTKGKAWSL
ncbi:MAG: gluconate 2-dehydrogenase subunit 3 family protein [Cellulophaga sp.]